MNIKWNVLKNKKFFNLLKDNWIQVIFWVVTCILLIAEIALLVSWQTSMNEKQEVTINGETMFTLQQNAKIQQIIVSTIALCFVVSLSLSIFVTVIIAYKKKREKNDNK